MTLSTMDWYHLGKSIEAARVISELEEQVKDLTEKLDDATRRDLDETRRLLYGAMAAPQTRKWEVVGTLANALLHHSGLSDQDPKDLIDRLVRIVEQQGADDAWLLDLIAEVNARLATTTDEQSAD